MLSSTPSRRGMTGNKPAPRESLHPEFVKALRPLGKWRLHALTGGEIKVICAMRGGRVVPATPLLLERLRVVASLVGYAGPLIAGGAR